MNEARVIADSVSPRGHRLTTMLVKLPRYILAELNTHRMLAKNAGSSRAIPIKKMLSSCWRDPVIPIRFGRNGKGMQDYGELPRWKRWVARQVWMTARLMAMFMCWLMHLVGVHKQVANRLIEPFLYVYVQISGTDWGNFFNLRCHPAAHPDMSAVAYAMLEAYRDSVPKKLEVGEYHLPWVDQFSSDDWTIGQKLAVSSARSARLSYHNFSGKVDIDDDVRLHDQLSESGHMSPFEHPAIVAEDDQYYGCFQGFCPYRKIFAKENRKSFHIDELMAKKQ